MKINIAGGNGEMGRTHAPIFRKAGHEVIISGRTSSPSLEEAAAQSDITIISVPIHSTENVIRRVAPHCKAMIDFTTVKEFPIEAMLKYSSQECEVAGLHPLYGEKKSIKGETIIFHPTERTGKRCWNIIRCFESAGADIAVLEPTYHDKLMDKTQTQRMKALEAFGMLLKESEITIKEAYRFSPPPTRVMLDLLARQLSEKRDELCEDMVRYNPYDRKTTGRFAELIRYAGSRKLDRKSLRAWFGDELKAAQNRAKKLIG